MKKFAKSYVGMTIAGILFFGFIASLTMNDPSKQEEAISDYIESNKNSTIIKNAFVLFENEQLFNFRTSASVYDDGNPFSGGAKNVIDSLSNGRYLVTIYPEYTKSRTSYPIDSKRYMKSTLHGQIKDYLLRFHFENEETISKVDALVIFETSSVELDTIIVGADNFKIAAYLLSEVVEDRWQFVQRAKKKALEEDDLRRQRVEENSSKGAASNGGLNNASISTWKNASEKDKLKTCEDMVASTMKLRGKKYTSLTQLNLDAIELKTCIDVAVKGEEFDDSTVAETAASCIVLLDYLF